MEVLSACILSLLLYCMYDDCVVHIAIRKTINIAIHAAIGMPLLSSCRCLVNVNNNTVCTAPVFNLGTAIAAVVILSLSSCHYHYSLNTRLEAPTKGTSSL